MTSEYQTKAVFCYDGSISSIKALSFVKTLHTLNIFSQLVNCYIYDHRKTYLPLEYQIMAMQQSLSQKFQEFTNVKKYVKPLQQKQTVIQQIIIGYDLEKCNLMVIGFYGRKGEKLNQQQLTPKVRRLVYDERLPLLIVKTVSDTVNENLNILYAYDGSVRSKSGLEQLKKAVEHKKVKLTILYVASKDQTKQPLLVRNDLKEFRSRNKGKISAQIKVIDNSVSPRQTLVDYINETKPDIVVITRNGHRGENTSQDFVGQTTSLILTHGNSNIWIIQ